MKKSPVSARQLSKLHLSRETLATLDVAKVAGGGPETRGFTNCPYCNSVTIQVPSEIPGGSC